MARRKHPYIFLALLIVIFAFWWGISVISGQSFSVPMLPSSSAAQVADGFVPASPIEITHSLSGGADTWSGAVTLPSACDSLGTGIAANGGSPAHVTLLLTVSRLPTCAAAQGKTNAEPFTVSLSRESSAPVFDGTTINGVIVPFALKEAGS